MQDDDKHLTDDEKYLKQGDVYFSKEEYGQAMEWYEKSANLNNYEAMLHMGRMYFDGIGIPKNRQKASELLKKGELIKEEKYFTQGDMYFAQEEYIKALECYKESASLKNSDAMYLIGHMYEEGLGVAKDLNQAIDWYVKSASLDNPDGMFRIGCFYFFGRNKNDDEAMDWFKKSAKLNHSEAMYVIGLMYASGKGVAQDPIKAKEWYDKSRQAESTS